MAHSPLPTLPHAPGGEGPPGGNAPPGGDTPPTGGLLPDGRSSPLPRLRLGKSSPPGRGPHPARSYNRAPLPFSGLGKPAAPRVTAQAAAKPKPIKVQVQAPTSKPKAPSRAEILSAMRERQRTALPYSYRAAQSNPRAEGVRAGRLRRLSREEWRELQRRNRGAGAEKPDPSARVDTDNPPETEESRKAAEMLKLGNNLRVDEKKRPATEEDVKEAARKAAETLRRGKP